MAQSSAEVVRKLHSRIYVDLYRGDKYIYTLKVYLVILVCGDVILKDREELEMPTRYWHKQLKKKNSLITKLLVFIIKDIVF